MYISGNNNTPSNDCMCPTIVRFAPTFTSPGGINQPKVIKVYLSNGQTIRQLLKANDDLRQDALIEQVFKLSNTLFATSTVISPNNKYKNKNTSTISCHVYTYNVIPLAPTVGLVE